jgi:tRNA/rRNA methyltransferase
VVLVATRNPLNIGAAARAMSNFGFLHLRVVNAYEVAFRAARSAVGASALLTQAEEYKTVAEAIADCTLVVGTTALGKRELLHPLKKLEEGARLIRRRMRVGKVALLFGSEKFGLSNNDLSHCHWLMRIPTREEHRSMNLGQAVAICLYELRRKAKVPGFRQKSSSAEKSGSPGKKEAAAAASEVERVTTILFDVLRDTRYWNPGASAPTEEKVRRLVRRLRLQANDAEVLLGMLRQILWKLRADRKRDENPPVTLC